MFQLLIDSEVLSAISKTRDEIRKMRARYVTMMSSGHDMMSLIGDSTNETQSNTSRHLKPQLPVHIVRSSTLL